MLLDYDSIRKILESKNIKISGAFHIGAHECEEIEFYNYLGIKNEEIIWVDAINSKVEEAINRGIPNVYNAIITDKDNDDIIFKISNNVQSSSILELGTHYQSYPHIVYVNEITGKSITVDTFFEQNNIDASKFNFWNFDIQGAELMALKGSVKSIRFAKAIYLEVNEKELYKNCGLMNEIDDFLLNYNFKRVLTNILPDGWGDALYIIDEEFKEQINNDIEIEQLQIDIINHLNEIEEEKQLDEGIFNYIKNLVDDGTVKPSNEEEV